MSTLDRFVKTSEPDRYAIQVTSQALEHLFRSCQIKTNKQGQNE